MKYEDLKVDELWMKKLIFAGIFIQENKLHTIYDNFGYISCKQWLLLVILQAYQSAPTLSEVGESMGCSRQNVKKLAVILEKKGLIELKKSSTDSRSVCIYQTPKYQETIDHINQFGGGAHEALFREFSSEDIVTYFELTKKLLRGIDNVGDYFLQIKKEINEKI